MSERRCISIVTPCFNEQENVAACREEVRNLFAEQLADYDHEHVFCDNRSSDGTVAELKQLAANDPQLKIIVNSRNFGPLASTFNGVLAASGDAVVVLLAADLQDPPAVIADMVRAWEQGNQIALRCAPHARGGAHHALRARGLLPPGAQAQLCRGADQRRQLPADRPLRRRCAARVRRSLPAHPQHDRQLRLQRQGGALRLGQAPRGNRQEQAPPPGQRSPERDDLVHQGADAPVHAVRLRRGGAQHHLCARERRADVRQYRQGRTVGHPDDHHRHVLPWAACSCSSSVCSASTSPPSHSQVRKRPLVIEAERCNF